MCLKLILLSGKSMMITSRKMRNFERMYKLRNKKMQNEFKNVQNIIQLRKYLNVVIIF